MYIKYIKFNNLVYISYIIFHHFSLKAQAVRSKKYLYMLHFAYQPETGFYPVRQLPVVFEQL